MTDGAVSPVIEKLVFILHSIIITRFFIGVWSVGRNSPPIAEDFQNISGGKEGEDVIKIFLPGVGFCGYELAIVVKFTQHAENSGRFP